jgi:hypothetical protein
MLCEPRWTPEADGGIAPVVAPHRHRPITVSRVRPIAPSVLIAATLVAGGGVACAAATPHGVVGVATSGTGTAGPGTIVNAGSGTGSGIPTGPPKGTAAEQTHPVVLPASGGVRTRFTVRFTLADAPGHTGVFASDYRLQVTVPAKARASRCSPQPPANVDAGTAGAVLRIPLTAPAGGWCVGRYRLTVFLQRGPYCPAPTAGQPPPPCPEFATQELDVGEISFRVSRPPPPAA